MIINCLQATGTLGSGSLRQLLCHPSLARNQSQRPASQLLTEQQPPKTPTLPPPFLISLYRQTSGPHLLKLFLLLRPLTLHIPLQATPKTPSELLSSRAPVTVNFARPSPSFALAAVNPEQHPRQRLVPFSCQESRLPWKTWPHTPPRAAYAVPDNPTFCDSNVAPSRALS